MPHLLATYAPRNGSPQIPPLDDVLMIDPPPALIIDGVTLFMPIIGPTRLTSRTRRNLAASCSSIEAKSRIPALFTRTDTGPKRASASATAAIHSSSLDTSRCR
jgi:hypothetical protein